MRSLNCIQSYQDDVRMIMKGCMQGNFIYVWNISDLSWARTQNRLISRTALNPLSYRSSICQETASLLLLAFRLSSFNSCSDFTFLGLCFGKDVETYSVSGFLISFL